MTFASKLESDTLALALEITPPRTSKPSVLLRRAGLLGEAADAINVIQRPDRQSSLSASVELRRSGLEAVWHLTTRGRAPTGIIDDLATAREASITQVLCIRGEGRDDQGTGQTVRATVAEVCEALPRVLVGATLNQYSPHPERAIRNLAGKLDAGASYIQTQPVYDVAEVERLVKLPNLAATRPRVVAMVMPLLSLETVRLVEERLSIKVPAAYTSRVSKSEAEAWTAFRDILAQLVASRHVDGLALMTFEMDSDLETGKRIVDALRDAGAVY